MSPEWIGYLPTLNASLNALSGVFLFTGFYFIRNKRIAAHKKMMIAACITSVLFLISYVIYHNNAGMTRFTAEGWARPTYFFILFTHIPLAALVLPLAIVTLFLALTDRFERHRRFARWTFPIWAYVSVTGVLVYLFLYHWFPGQPS